MSALTRFAPPASPPRKADLVLVGSIEPVAGTAGRELHSQAGAGALARQLQNFWESRGFTTANFTVDRAAFRGRRGDPPALWLVRSNLVNGVPPRRPAPVARPAPATPVLQDTARRVLEALAEALAAGERVTRAVIAARCGLAQGTISHVMTGLKADGYLSRKGPSCKPVWAVLRDAEGRALRRARKARAA